MQPLILLLSTLTLITCTSLTTTYQYISNGQEIRLSDPNAPIKFNGLPIGTTELTRTTAPGTSHPLSSGHHFTHPGWVLNGTNTDNSSASWVYLPTLQSSTKLSPKPIPTVTEFEFLSLRCQGSGCSGLVYQMSFDEILLPDDVVLGVGSIVSGAESATAFQYLTLQEDFLVDLVNEGFVVASATSLTADFENLFFTALKFFA